MRVCSGSRILASCLSLVLLFVCLACSEKKKAESDPTPQEPSTGRIEAYDPDAPAPPTAEPVPAGYKPVEDPGSVASGEGEQGKWGLVLAGSKKIVRLVFKPRQGAFEEDRSAEAEGIRRLLFVGEALFATDGKHIFRLSGTLEKGQEVLLDSVEALATDGKTIFAAAANSLVALDINLKELSRVELDSDEPRNAQDILVQDGIAYLLAGKVEPMCIFRIDVQNPAGLALKDRIDFKATNTKLEHQWFDKDNGQWIVVSRSKLRRGTAQIANVFPKTEGTNPQYTQTIYSQAITGRRKKRARQVKGEQVVTVSRSGPLFAVLRDERAWHRLAKVTHAKSKISFERKLRLYRNPGDWKYQFLSQGNCLFILSSFSDLQVVSLDDDPRESLFQNLEESILAVRDFAVFGPTGASCPGLTVDASASPAGVKVPFGHPRSARLPRRLRLMQKVICHHEWGDKFVSKRGSWTAPVSQSDTGTTATEAQHLAAVAHVMIDLLGRKKKTTRPQEIIPGELFGAEPVKPAERLWHVQKKSRQNPRSYYVAVTQDANHAFLLDDCKRLNDFVESQGFDIADEKQAVSMALGRWSLLEKAPGNRILRALPAPGKKTLKPLAKWFEENDDVLFHPPRALERDDGWLVGFFEWGERDGTLRFREMEFGRDGVVTRDVHWKLADGTGNFGMHAKRKRR